jgi:altronate dehydratase small subunit
MPRYDALVLDARDNVATALRPLEAGSTARIGGAGGERTLSVAEAIPLCHKLALAELSAGEQVLKYGEPIGRARERIASGTCVHVHNMTSDRAKREA